MSSEKLASSGFPACRQLLYAADLDVLHTTSCLSHLAILTVALASTLQ